MIKARSALGLFTLLVLVALTACSPSKPSIVGKWSGWMVVDCPDGKPPVPNYRPLTISLDLGADGRCTNVHGSGIGADITVHSGYELRDSLFLYTTDFGADTLHLVVLSESELVLRRAPYENGCVHTYRMERAAPGGTAP
ncbi:MAG: hypothetical protein JNM62_13115 [Flavobacteriales bacterium]|nr:hypothetical protein [Flavobacteriales bacterium]